MSTIRFHSQVSGLCQESARAFPSRFFNDDTAADRQADIFESHRSRLLRIASRMLGTHADAEDIVQEAYLRWHLSDTRGIESPVAFMVTITTRLCFDRLRELKQEREHSNEPGLNEPAFDDYVPSPETNCELAEDVSVAFLAVIERLGPEERAVFLLHDVFDYDYSEIAEMTGKSEPACRQMISRARPRVREPRRRYAVTEESRALLLKKFLAAVGAGGRKAVVALLAEDVVCTPSMAMASSLRL